MDGRGISVMRKQLTDKWQSFAFSGRINVAATACNPAKSRKNKIAFQLFSS
jgi:hypothetical protein